MLLQWRLRGKWIKKSIKESVRRTRYQVQLYAKEAGNEGRVEEGRAEEGLVEEGRVEEGCVEEGRDEEGRDEEGRVKECHDDVGREEPLLIAIDVQVEPQVEPVGGGHDT